MHIMACNGGGGSCQSGGCYKDNNDADEESTPNGVVSTAPTTTTTTTTTDDLSRFCTKCKSNPTISATEASFAGGGDGGRFCSECFRSNLQWKFRFAVTSNAMVSPRDKVLVAFSGGPSSRVVLQFVHEMQYKAQMNSDASRDKALPVFGVGIAVVNESALCQVPSDEFAKAVKDIEVIVSSLSPPTKELHVVPIESIFSLDRENGKDKLNELLNAVSDVTGKEDLLLHLRTSLLQKIALENGYTKLVLGTCTSRIACHVLAATVKGQGYSLAADIQYVDARWEIPMVLPLRDCLAQELEMLCHLDSLKTIELFERPRAGINGLVSSFVKLLQEENSSRESTIMRTAGKLTPFHFNRIPESDDFDAHLASKRRQKKYNLKSDESLPPESFCPICNSPLNKSDSVVPSNGNDIQFSSQTFASVCCSSCQFQILPEDSLSMNHFCSMLPHPILGRAKDVNHAKQRWLRDQVQDCLLSDGEDE